MARGVKKVNEAIFQEGRTLIVTENNRDNLEWDKIPDGTLKIDPITGMMHVKIKEEPDWLPATAMQDGTVKIAKDAKIVYEKFVVVNPDNGDGTFTYEVESGDRRTKPLMSEGYQVFELEKGSYVTKRNALEVFVNATLHRSAGEGGLVEIDEKRFGLKEKKTSGTVILAKYIVKFDIGSPYPRIHIGEEPPLDQEYGDIWIDTKGFPNEDFEFIPDDNILDHINNLNNPHNVRKDHVGLNNVTNHAQIKKNPSSISGNIPTWEGANGDLLGSGYGIETSLEGKANCLATANAIKSYIDTRNEENVSYKASISCEERPNYPSASKGDLYKVSSNGQIGGINGPEVEEGDVILCIKNSAVGSHSTVKDNWVILQGNIIKAVTSTTTSGLDNIVAFSDSSGKKIKDTGFKSENLTSNETQVLAGGGLSGGGNLKSNITLNIGIPSTITDETVNSVEEESHTHEIKITHGKLLDVKGATLGQVDSVKDKHISNLDFKQINDHMSSTSPHTMHLKAPESTEIFIQNSKPVGAKTGDIWIDTSLSLGTK